MTSRQELKAQLEATRRQLDEMTALVLAAHLREILPDVEADPSADAHIVPKPGLESHADLVQALGDWVLDEVFFEVVGDQKVEISGQSSS